MADGGNKKRKVTLAVREFLRRFLLHALPCASVFTRTGISRKSPCRRPTKDDPTLSATARWVFSTRTARQTRVLTLSLAKCRALASFAISEGPPQPRLESASGPHVQVKRAFLQYSKHLRTSTMVSCPLYSYSISALMSYFPSRMNLRTS